MTLSQNCENVENSTSAHHGMRQRMNGITYENKEILSTDWEVLCLKQTGAEHGSIPHKGGEEGPPDVCGPSLAKNL